MGETALSLRDERPPPWRLAEESELRLLPAERAVVRAVERALERAVLPSLALPAAPIGTRLPLRLDGCTRGPGAGEPPRPPPRAAEPYREEAAGAGVPT